MSQSALPIAGSCRCGQVRFHLARPPLITTACHCRGCQRMTASAFSLSALVPADAFVVVAGEPVVGGLHGADRHFHCPHCKSWLFTRPSQAEGFVNVRTVMLDDAQWSTPFMETYTSEKLPWAATPAQHSFARFPPPDAYEGLIRAYAGQ